MIHAVLLCCAILGDGGKPAGPTGGDRAAYEAARANAGENPAAHVQLALWCEAHGFPAERIKHLTLAAGLDPKNVLAQGLMGLVTFQGKLAKPVEVKDEIQSDPKSQALFREYLDRRVRTPQKADAQLRLAAWCLENGLNDEALAHYHLVTRLDPSRDIAWIRLRYKKHKDRWQRPEDLAAQKLEADLQKHADQQWKPRLEKLRDAMESPVETRRLKAEREVYQVTDPRAVPAVFRTFGSGNERMQLVSIELLSQIDGPMASLCLLAIAIEKPSNEVRDRAGRALALRDPRDVIDLLIRLVRKPFKYEVKPGNGLGTTGVLFVEGERFDFRRLYRFPDVLPQFAAINNQVAREFLASALMGEAMRRDAVVQETLENDVQTIEAMNAQIEQTNSRALPLLETLTGQSFGANPQQWQAWWADQLGLVIDNRYADVKPVLSDVVGLPDVVAPPIVPAFRAPAYHPAARIAHHSACFSAGTLVQTIIGPRKIESLAIGDRVLAQNTTSGALSFQPVLATHLNGPAETLRITIDGESIVATGIHRFWKAGKGWTMARELNAGDRLRMIDGVVTIQSIQPDATQKVYNLTIAENRDFMVGNSGLLVHDYSFVVPVSEPFDRPANLARKTPE